MYKFSETTVIERYGVKMYSVLNEKNEVVAYSQTKFDINKQVIFKVYKEPALIFEKAVIRGGVIWGGVIWGGVIWGGVIWGGVIWGGVIRGGEIWGGVIWGGEIRGGEYTHTMLQIQGTKHFCYAYFLESGGVGIGIGCVRMSIGEWLSNYTEFGTRNNYSLEEIEEYKSYIDLFARMYLK